MNWWSRDELVMARQIGDDKMHWWWRDELVMARWIVDDKINR